MKKIIFTFILCCFSISSFAEYRGGIPQDDYRYKTTYTPYKPSEIEGILFGQKKSLKKDKWEWFKPINLTTITFGSELGDYTNVAYKPYTLWGLHMSALGVYYDVGWTESQMGDSSKIGVWNDCNARYWHIGYTIPISKWFTITPLYGKITNNSLVVNGQDWWVDSISGSICNRTEIVDTKLYTDYGVVLNVNLCMDFLNDMMGTSGAELWALYVGAKITKYQKAVTFGVTYNIGKTVKLCKKNKN